MCHYIHSMNEKAFSVSVDETDYQEEASTTPVRAD